MASCTSFAVDDAAGCTVNNYRFERIARLLDELKYEVTRGMMEGDIEETMEYRFVVPVSKALPHGMVLCQFRTRPCLPHDIFFDEHPEPRLRVVK